MTIREKLLSEAKDLGLNFPKNIKTDALSEAVETKKMEIQVETEYEEAGGMLTETETLEPPSVEEIRAQLEKEYASKLMIEKAKMQANMELNTNKEDEVSANNRRSVGQAKLKARQEAFAMVRVNITSKDPMKASWPGEIISSGNDVVGNITKYVDFDTEDGYHIPKIIYNTLKEKKCTVFVNKRINGQMVNVAKQVNAYNIEVLPPLSKEELKALSDDQRARHATDDN